LSNQDPVPGNNLRPGRGPSVGTKSRKVPLQKVVRKTRDGDGKVHAEERKKKFPPIGERGRKVAGGLLGQELGTRGGNLTGVDERNSRKKQGHRMGLREKKEGKKGG